jgi:putative oxidoreductase
MNGQTQHRIPTIFHRVEAGSIAGGIIVLLGRLLFVLIFLKTGPNLFSKQTISYVASQGVPFAMFAVPTAGVLALAGGVSVLVGFRTKIGASLIALFLIPVTVMMHRFWSVSDAGMAQMQMIMFLKNLAILGGALLISQFGAGPLSLDARRSR